MLNYISLYIQFLFQSEGRSQWTRRQRLGSAAARWLGMPVRIPPGERMSLSFESCAPITCPEESYRVWCVCALESSTRRRLGPLQLSSLDKKNSYRKPSNTKTNQLLLYEETVTVYPKNHIKFINTLCKE